jgi:tetratricopeptide (TPR) repeat protein
MAHTTLRDYLQDTEDAISSGRIDDAIANCQHILSYFPDALEAQRLLGEVYLAQGKLEEAQQTFDWILTNDPENIIAYCDRALTSERLSDIETALDCYQQAYELSRGNSQIRQEFNQLSAKVGQQEFMFSRAGLARLYMRGDLLTQAIQEWEAVLNASPGRLDARTGLLETYWREGLYDKVKELATEILEEIPTCLKALLLLAYVTSTFSLEQAKELIQRAEALDPELAIAQELFSDLIARQTNDPFVTLVKKEPAVFTDVSDEKQISKVHTATSTAVEANGSHSSEESSDQPYGWSNLESWSELDTVSIPQHGAEPTQEASAVASWVDNANIQNVDSWATFDETGQDQSELDPEAWKTSLEIDDDFDPAILEQQLRFQADQFTRPTAEPDEASENLSTIESTESVYSWSTVTQDDGLPSPPAWLDMLTKVDQQPGGSISTSSTQSSVVQESPGSMVLAQSQEEAVPTSPQLRGEDFSTVSASPAQEEPAFFFSSEDNDPDLRWPEWLKSLGAESIEPESELEAAPVTPEETRQPTAFQAWADQIDQMLSEAGEEQMATLEHLEIDLRSQGFVPLQPGTLSTITQEPSLSSAFAQLGNFTAPPAAPEPPGVPVQPVTSTQPAASFTPAEPTLSPVAPAEQVQPAELEPWWGDTPNQGFEMPASPVDEQSIYPGSAVQEADYTEAILNQIFEPLASTATNPSQQAPLIPAYQAEALLENELEMTMKRPAMRLQPIQQSAAQADISNMMGRGRSAEHGAGSKAPDVNLSNKERLLRGYHFQLAGAYDDAMQEYRIIIRNAPELLSEVISNVRALLKLTPKYSAGFRVLGDAYMRQGEYLQAMEAYNKALTIAKKAKSQSF